MIYERINLFKQLCRYIRDSKLFLIISNKFDKIANKSVANSVTTREMKVICLSRNNVFQQLIISK